MNKMNVSDVFHTLCVVVSWSILACAVVFATMFTIAARQFLWKFCIGLIATGVFLWFCVPIIPFVKKLIALDKSTLLGTGIGAAIMIGVIVALCMVLGRHCCGCMGCGDECPQYIKDSDHSH
jgi:hypothetical protein